MLVQINTVIPKRGQYNKVVELINSAGEYAPFQIPFRVLVPSIGPFDVVIFEQEFKDMAEQDRFWKGWTEKAPDSFWTEWNEVTENGGKNEIWQIAE